MAKHLAVDHTKCVGCRLCELACSFGKTNTCSPSQARIKVHLIGFPEVPVPIYQENCDYCGGDPECVKYCFPEAITYSEDNPRPDLRNPPDPEEVAREWLAAAWAREGVPGD